MWSLFCFFTLVLFIAVNWILAKLIINRLRAVAGKSQGSQLLTNLISQKYRLHFLCCGGETPSHEFCFIVQTERFKSAVSSRKWITIFLKSRLYEQNTKPCVLSEACLIKYRLLRNVWMFDLSWCFPSSFPLMSLLCWEKFLASKLV